MMSKKTISKLLMIGVISTSMLTKGASAFASNGSQTNKSKIAYKNLNVSQQRNNSKDINEIVQGKGNTLYSNKEFTFGVGTAKIQYSSVHEISTDDNYVPSVDPNSKLNVISSGTNVVLTVPYYFNSTSKNVVPIQNVWITADPTFKYINKSSNPKDLENNPVDAKIEGVNTLLGNQESINSTSCGTLLSTISFPNVDWKQTIDLGLKINFEANGQTYSYRLNVPTLKTTNKYSVNNTANINTTTSNGEQYLNVGFNMNTYSNLGEKGFYNPLTHKIESITFKTESPSDINLVPIDSSYLKKNSDGTYTVSGPLVNSINGNVDPEKLFKIEKNSGTYTAVVKVTPVSITYKGLENVNYILGQNNYSAQCDVINSSYKNNYQMSQSSVDKNAGDSGLNGIITNYNSIIGKDLPGKYMIYSGSLIYRGEVFFVGGSDNYMNRLNPKSKNEYVYLNEENRNIMKSGTAQQKSDLMQKIVQGKVGTIYTTADIVSMNDKKMPLPNVNFIFTSKQYTGGNLEVSGEYTKVPSTRTGNYNMTSNTYTLGIAQSGTTSEDVSKLQGGLAKGYDTLVKNSNGENVGFFLGSANDKVAINRFGHADVGFSNYTPYLYTVTGLNIDNDMQVNQAPYTRDVQWAHREHNFKFYFSSIGETRTEYLKKGSEITLHMGAPFILNSSIKINGQVLSANDYKIEGDNIVITTPHKIVHDYQKNFYHILNIDFSATYSVFDNQKIVPWMKLGKTGLDGLVYYFNNQNQIYTEHGSSWCTNDGINIDVINTSKNYCLQTSTGLNKNNTTKITNVIYNPNPTPNNFLVLGGIPAKNYNVSSSLGFIDYGDLKPNIENFGDQYDTWVLPKDKMNVKNEQIISEINNDDMSDTLQYIENPNSGWIKYEKGMNLNNIASYAVKANIPAKSSAKFSYKVNFTNVQSDKYQLGNTAFKYFNINGKVGANSNVVTLAPKNSVTNNTYITAVQNNLGQGIYIPYLMGHGNNKDENNKTPKALMQKINWASGMKVDNTQKTLADYGYELTGIKVNGIVRNLSWFKDNGISNNTGVTSVVFMVEHHAPFSIKVNSSNAQDKNSDINTVLKTGDKYPIANINMLIDRIQSANKNNERVENITWNGKNYTKDINGFITDLKKIEAESVNDNSKGQDIKVTFKINESTTNIKVITNDGKRLEAVSEHGAVGSALTKNVEIPTGYEVTGITLDGKTITKDDVPKTFATKNQDIVYIVKKIPTNITVKIVDGDKVFRNTSTTGEPDSNASIEGFKNISGYEVQSVTVNGKEVVNKDGTPNINVIPSKFENSNVVIVYNLKKMGEYAITNSMTTIDGNVIVKPVQVAKGYEGQKEDIKPLEIPKGYQLVQVKVNGDVISKIEKGKVEYNLPTQIGKKDINIEYVIKKIPVNMYVEVITTNGKVVYENNYIGEEGQKIPHKIVIGDGYKLVKIIVDGQESKKAPTKFAGENQKVVYIIEKITSETPNKPEESNKPEVPSKPVTPEKPNKPEVPSKPVTPEKPNKPEVPSKPVTPEDPNKPELPSKPVTPEKPNKPEVPSKPVTPEKPNKPEVPSKPVTPEKPNKPEVPSKPILPENINKSDISNTQEGANKEVNNIYASGTTDKVVVTTNNDKVEISGLPDTGIPQNNKKEVAGALAGILAMLGLAISRFIKKK